MCLAQMIGVLHFSCRLSGSRLSFVFINPNRIILDILSKSLACVSFLRHFDNLFLFQWWQPYVCSRPQVNDERLCLTHEYIFFMCLGHISICTFISVISTVSTEKAITCDDGTSIQRLSCGMNFFVSTINITLVHGGHNKLTQLVSRH